MAVSHETISMDDADQRLDRWLRRRFPGLTQGRLSKLLRTGQIRIDGARAKGNHRLEVGQVVRIPPIDVNRKPLRSAARKNTTLDPKTAEQLKSWIIYQDDLVIALNKPPGLPVQGGTNSDRNLDVMLGGLAKDGERPRLVHRLDKDTSGVLLLARSRKAATALTAAFRHRDAQKLYWALVVGEPHRRRGLINLALIKGTGRGVERMYAVDDPTAPGQSKHGSANNDGQPAETAQRASTRYATIDHAANQVSWLAMKPLTGRTHQLRVHAASLGTPVLGDGKYGGSGAFLSGMAVTRKLHLHARRLILPHPSGGVLDVTAELPKHMMESWALFGFDPKSDDDPFEFDTRD